MLTPGAIKFNKLFLLKLGKVESSFCMLPTGVAFCTQAGPAIEVTLLVFPLATTTGMLCPTASFISAAKGSSLQYPVDNPPPKLILITEILNVVALATHHLIPAIIASSGQDPVELHTFSITILLSGATPVIVPLALAIPLTWVPCPFKSSGVESLAAQLPLSAQ